jgi:Transglutaminase-like superfamily
MKTSTMQRKYWLEASVFLGIVRLAIRLLPSRWLVGGANRHAKQIRRFNGYEIPWISWAIESAGTKESCLARALATQYMLRRRGIASNLCFGVARDENGNLRAHAWVKAGQEVIVGGFEGELFTELTHSGEGVNSKHEI